MGRRIHQEEGIGGFLILLALILWAKVGTTGFIVIVSVIFVVALSLVIIFKRRRKLKLLRSGISLIDCMTGEMFEALLLEHFKQLGYKGKLTPKTADYGADLIIEKENERIIVQAKRWRQQVGIEAIQQTAGAVNYYNANKGMVITNSYFTQNAKKLAKSCGIELWDREKLITFLSQARGRELADMVIDEQVYDSCPFCGKAMVYRHDSRGKFWGCSECKHTEPFEP